MVCNRTNKKYSANIKDIKRKLTLQEIEGFNFIISQIHKAKIEIGKISQNILQNSKLTKNIEKLDEAQKCLSEFTEHYTERRNKGIFIFYELPIELQIKITKGNLFDDPVIKELIKENLVLQGKELI